MKRKIESQKCHQCLVLYGTTERQGLCTECFEFNGGVDMEPVKLKKHGERLFYGRFERFADSIFDNFRRTVDVMEDISMIKMACGVSRKSYLLLLSLCSPQQPWSVNRLVEIFRKNGTLALTTEEAWPILIYFVNQFSHDPIASSTFQCVIAQHIIDRHILSKWIGIMLSTSPSPTIENQKLDAGCRFDDTMRCYYTSQNPTVVATRIVKDRPHIDVFRNDTKKRSCDDLIMTKTVVHYNYALTTMLLLAKKYGIPTDIKKMIWINMFAKGWGPSIDRFESQKQFIK